MQARISERKDAGEDGDSWDGGATTLSRISPDEWRTNKIAFSEVGIGRRGLKEAELRRSAQSQRGEAAAEADAANAAAKGNAATASNQLANISKMLGSHVTFTVGDKQSQTLSGKLWAYDPSLGVVGLECEPTTLPSHLQSAPAAAASVAQASQTSRNRFAQASAAVGFTIVKVSEIKKIEFRHSTDAANGAASQAQSLTPIHPVSLKAAQLREADAVKQSLTKVARTGKDVSQLGQQVFDALSKTLVSSSTD
ncbi:hypothetical protein L1887_42088 [Cichorium endivia]|nr:hypothetical protein L1887_42088 [Cichorium endivia]